MKRRLISAFIAGMLLLCTTTVALAADYTFTDRTGKTITVKDGEYSFATRVVEFTQGDPWTKRENEQDPASTLGAPDTGNEGKTELNLGKHGVLVLEFNVSIIDGDGDDLYVFEVGGDVEATIVEVSNDLQTWYPVGTAEGKTAGVDIHGKVPEGSRFRYIRLTDRDGSYSSWPGADIDAVIALNSKNVTSDWSETEIDRARDYDLVPDILDHAVMTEPITRLEFVAVSVKTYEKLTSSKSLPATVNPFVDCNDLEMLKGYNLGITVGTSDTTFSPDDLLDREQCATMLTRMFKRATIPGWTYPTDGNFSLQYTRPAPFADDLDISFWAKDSVYFMAANKIILGVGDNYFAPRNSTPDQEARYYANATREQALAIAVRMVENLN